MRHAVTATAAARWTALLLASIATTAGLPAALAADAPNWTLTAVDGTEVSFDEARREGPSIVLFWATWCPYCKALMPHLQSMLEEYDGERALRVYAISYREDGDPVRYLQRQGYSFIAFPDGGDVPERYDIAGTPALFVVNESGLITLNLYQVSANMRSDDSFSSLSNREQAARRAPYWAARIREALDGLY
jgi:cytochrome c biogenesis protein CcmG/thiol:disulfide interchange protein DsbE